MTVKDLIEHLQQYPQDTVIGVLYQAFSDYSILEPEDIEFLPNGKVKAFSNEKRYILRGGRVMEYDERTWDKRQGEPQFISLLIFPGN